MGSFQPIMQKGLGPSYVSIIDSFSLGCEGSIPVFLSNGLTEGFVNWLKLVKRMIHDRGSFEFLRQRVLSAIS